jgi:acyl carrier protein
VTTNEFLEKLNTSLGKTDGPLLTKDTQLSDINEWDSAGQIGTLYMLAETFNVVLQMDELVSIKSVQDIIDILNSRDINLE